MHKIRIFPGKFSVNQKEIRSCAISVLKDQKIKNNVEININCVDDETMTSLHLKYMRQEGTTDVLSFPVNEIKSVGFQKGLLDLHSGLVMLGDIVICWPQAKRQAEERGLKVNQEINSLVQHGVLHLLGIHHEE